MTINIQEGETIQIELRPSNYAYSGDYSIQLLASLEDYPFVEPVEMTLAITIDNTCKVSIYEVDDRPENFSFIIGEGPVSGGYYNFGEIGSRCNYDDQVEVTNLPDFVTHNEESQDFTV